LDSKLDLKRAETFGYFPALEVLRQLVGPRPDDETETRQAAVASFTRFGFEAAAITALGVRAADLRRTPSEAGFERTATPRFDHPYAAMPITGWVPSVESLPIDSSLVGLPLFSAWVHEPDEPEEDPPTGPRSARH
jgi:hypothetical protein